MNVEIQKLSIKEQIVKPVVKSGNGGAVWVPKDWLGEEVVVILPEKQKLSVRERIIHILEPYLKDIISVGIYGSYARNEQTKDSDVDVLVLTKDKHLKLDSGKENIEITSFPIGLFKKAIEKYPAIYYQMLQEAKPLINAPLLEELQSIQIKKESFKGYIKETREHLKSNRELLELDKLDGKYLKSNSVIYSSMLRLRTLFIIQCILKKDAFSNKKFKGWLISQNLSFREFEDCYKIYTMVRDNKSIKKVRMRISTVEKLLNILGIELRKLEGLIW